MNDYLNLNSKSFMRMLINRGKNDLPDYLGNFEDLLMDSLKKQIKATEYVNILKTGYDAGIDEGFQEGMEKGVESGIKNYMAGSDRQIFVTKENAYPFSNVNEIYTSPQTREYLIKFIDRYENKKLGTLDEKKVDIEKQHIDLEKKVDSIDNKIIEGIENTNIDIEDILDDDTDKIRKKLETEKSNMEADIETLKKDIKALKKKIRLTEPKKEVNTSRSSSTTGKKTGSKSLNKEKKELMRDPETETKLKMNKTEHNNKIAEYKKKTIDLTNINKSLKDLDDELHRKKETKKDIKSNEQKNIVIGNEIKSTKKTLDDIKTGAIDKLTLAQRYREKDLYPGETAIFKTDEFSIYDTTKIQKYLKDKPIVDNEKRTILKDIRTNSHNNYDKMMLKGQINDHRTNIHEEVGIIDYLEFPSNKIIDRKIEMQLSTQFGGNIPEDIKKMFNIK